MNSFQELQRWGEEQYTERHDERLRSHMDGTLGTFRFLGQVIDIYLPRMVDTFMAVATGRAIQTEEHRHAPTDPATGERPSQGPWPEEQPNIDRGV